MRIDFALLDPILIKLTKRILIFIHFPLHLTYKLFTNSLYLPRCLGKFYNLYLLRGTFLQTVEIIC
jgi:hypothetical protein